jgi:SAM-dependent methyltransferase
MPAISQQQLFDSMQRVRTAMDPGQFSRYAQQVLWRFEESFQEVPRNEGDQLLIDMGCYGPLIGPFHDLLGYRRIGAVAMYDWGPLDSVVLPAWAQETGIDLSLWFGNLEVDEVPWTRHEADVVLMLEILEHFSVDPMKVLCQVNRVLRPGGKLVLSTPNAASADALFQIVFGHNPQPERFNGLDTNRHNRLYDHGELTTLLETAGFADIRVRTMSPPKPGLRNALIQGGAYALSLCTVPIRGRKAFARGDYLLASGTKVSEPVERYPRFLYEDRELFRDWYERLSGKPVERAVSVFPDRL